MSFYVPKAVRSPGCDHGHDEESRNGRDMKIDILDHVIRTPEVFRMVSGKIGVPEGLGLLPAAYATCRCAMGDGPRPLGA